MQKLKIFIALMLITVLSACGGGLIGDVDESHPTQQAPKNKPNFNLEYNDKNQLILNWDHQSDVQTYTLYFSTSETFESNETTLITLDQPPYVVEPESTGQTYYVKLKSSWFGNESVESQLQTFIAPPFVPDDLVSVVTEDNTIKLNWASVEGAESYTVYRHTSNILDLNSAVVTENVIPPYVDNSLIPDQEYFYWLVATTSDQASAFSTVSSAKTSTVLEENQSPVFTSPNNFSINENNDSIGTVTADDDLTEALIFSIISGDDASLFTLNNNSGELTFNNTPDYETPSDSDLDNVYQLTLKISDGEKSTQQAMEITVLDIDDDLPVIPEIPPELNFSIANIDVTESDGRISLGIVLNKANTQRPITLDVNTLSGTASIDDYLAMTNQHLTIAAGETQQNIEIEVFDDNLYEGENSESFTVTLSNVVGAKLGNQFSVIVNINDNDPQPTIKPIANAGLDQTVFANSLVTLDGTASKANDESGSLNYLWTPPNGIKLSAIGVVQPTFTVPIGTKAGTAFLISLMVSNTDDTNSESDSVNIVVVNSDPIADAGLDQSARVGDLVTLDASASTDLNKDNLSYEWSGPTNIRLSNITSQQPTFTIAQGVEAGTSYLFTLTINDDQGGKHSDDVEVTIFDTVPNADAGPDQNSRVGDLVTLDASASTDPNNDILKYLWTAPAGIFLSNVNGIQPEFTIPIGTKTNSSLEFNLTVSDNQGSSNSDSVIINVLNTPPTANAGLDQNASVGDKITLNASTSSDPNNDTLDYLWAAPNGVSPSTSTLVQPTFTIPIGASSDANLVFQLTVDDNKGGTSNDNVSVSIINTKPTANAGPDQSASVGDIVSLTASGSTDPNNDTLNYLWVAPNGVSPSTATLVQPEFTIPIDATSDADLIFQLTVDDNRGGISTDSVSVSIINTNPTANAGIDQNATAGEKVTLDGSGSFDPNNGSLTYSWLKPDNIKLSDSASIQPTYIVPQGLTAGTVFTFELTVTNNQGSSHSDEVVTTLTNTPPIANTGPNKSIVIGGTANFDGSASSDINGDNLTYVWSIISSEDGSEATLNNETSIQSSFTPDVLGSYIFQLTVDDGLESNSDTLQLNVVNFNTPEMVPITGGSFQMGDETSVDGVTQGAGAISELPVHNVTIADFELGKYEVTFSEYDQYLSSRTTNPISDPSSISSGEAWDSAGSGRASRPVVMVSWNDIQNYLAWLNEQLGYALDDPKRYRLPTEAEWEFAARAGQLTTFNSGNCINTDQANYNGESDYAYTKSNGESVNCPATNIYRKKSETVGSFAANQYGLHDMHGNVRELTEDKCHDNYLGAPNDGSAWLEQSGLCSNYRSARGGAWNNSMSYLRSAARMGNLPTDRYGSLGFRLARTP